MNDTVSYSELRENLKHYLDRVCDEHEPLLVKRRNGRNVVIVDAEDYAALDETDYLLSSPANRKHLEEALKTPRSQCITYPSIQALKDEFDL